MITVITGPMFAGKTTRLQQVAREAKDAGLDVRCFKHANDTRYHPEHLVNHDEEHFPATACRTAGEILDASYGADVVCIDEAQMFPSMLSACIRVLNELGIAVFVACLNRTSSGDPFPTMEAIQKYPHNLEVFTSLCSVCGDNAIYTQRKPGVQPGHIGGTESYETRCEQHFTGDKE